MIEKVSLTEVGDEQIEEAVIIIIAPGAAFGIPDVSDDGARGNSGERAGTVIVVKKVPLAAPIRDKQIQKTVIIVIPPGASHGISDIIRDITCCYSVEGAVVVGLVVVGVDGIELVEIGELVVGIEPYSKAPISQTEPRSKLL